MESLMVFMPRISKRAEYIFYLLLRDLMGVEMILTDRLEDYSSYSGPRIEYNDFPMGKGLFIQCCGLLQEKSVKSQDCNLFTYNNIPAFFPIKDSRSALPFDLFAASFYLVTRYEEYLPFAPDKFGRFNASDSITTIGNFLRIPVVNLWMEMLKEHLRIAYPLLKFHEKKYRFIPTIDIDHAFAYKQHSIIRTIGGSIRSMMIGDLKKLAERIKVLLGRLKDPYDQYDFIREIHERFGLNPYYFVLFADYGRNDNNVSLSGSLFCQLIRTLDYLKTLGIHPSLASGTNPDILQSEINGLSELLGHQIYTSRQHFLKVSFPHTYRDLIKNGITDDYSLAYASNPGFRAGVADPFPFFDLIANKAERLIIHPVTLMDVTLKDYLGVDPAEAIALVRSFVDTVKALNGEFVTIWHNESFHYSGRWKGWEEVYTKILSYAL
ncbi:MAG: polysaccharide deacetylase family protein [Bacteroidales bacterium]|jgi:hypothetical protein